MSRAEILFDLVISGEFWSENASNLVVAFCGRDVHHCLLTNFLMKDFV